MEKLSEVVESPDDDLLEARQLIGVIARLIRSNGLHAANKEDTIGVLIRCGAFREFERKGSLARLAGLVDDHLADWRVEAVRRLTFSSIEVGDHFVTWPSPRCAEEPRGYREARRLYVKITDGTARSGAGARRAFEPDTSVIRVSLG